MLFIITIKNNRNLDVQSQVCSFKSLNKLIQKAKSIVWTSKTQNVQMIWWLKVVNKLLNSQFLLL